MKAYVSIDDGGYPVFNLSEDKASSVEVTASRYQVARWKKTFAAYASVQKELHELVDYYEPTKIRKTSTKRKTK